MLDENGQPIGPWDPRLEPDRLRQGLRAMMLTRAYDERMLRAQRQLRRQVNGLRDCASLRCGNRTPWQSRARMERTLCRGRSFVPASVFTIAG